MKMSENSINSTLSSTLRRPSLQLKPLSARIPQLKAPAPPKIDTSQFRKNVEADMKSKLDAIRDKQEEKRREKQAKDDEKAAKAKASIEASNERRAAQLRLMNDPSLRQSLSVATTFPAGNVVVYGLMAILAIYTYASIRQGGIDVDGSGNKRNIFRWVDAACGALIGMTLFRFARSMY